PGKAIPACPRPLIISRLGPERPAHLAESHRLAGEPFAQSAPRLVVFPMFRLRDRLAIELEEKIGMPGLQKIWCQILMASRAGRRAHVKTAEIAHAGADPGVVSPILAGMASQPSARRAVAAFAGDAFIRMRGRREAMLRHGLKRSMANRATRARGRRGGTAGRSGDFQVLRDPVRS